MAVEFQDYFISLFLIPCFVGSVSLAALIMCIKEAVRFVHSDRRREKNKRKRIVDYIKHTLRILLILALFQNSVVGLFYGIPLFLSKENSTVTLQGNITGIYQTTTLTTYHLADASLSRGYVIMIDKTDYFIASRGSLEVGDQIEAECLDGSRVILAITEIFGD